MKNTITLLDAVKMFYDLRAAYVEQYPELAGWKFEFDNAQKRLGFCQYSTKTIGLSRRLTSYRTAAEVRNTLLHEMAHAVTWGDGHGHKWRRVFMQMGGDGKRCGAFDVPVEQAIQIFKYVAKCPGCGRVAYAGRALKSRRSCGVCAPSRFDERYELKYVPANTFAQ